MALKIAATFSNMEGGPLNTQGRTNACLGGFCIENGGQFKEFGIKIN